MANVCLLAALEEEILPVAKHFHLKKEKYFYTSKWFNKKILLLKTGVGKVNAASVTQLAINNDKIDLFINFGLTGGFTKKVKIGDVIMPHQVIQYDLDQRKLGINLGVIPNINRTHLPLSVFDLRNNIKQGICITADKILSDRGEAETISQLFDPSIVDMELGAIAQTCFHNQVKLAALKSPADIVENEEVSHFTDNINICMSNICRVLEETLVSLNVI